jgi:hypothetical protein
MNIFELYNVVITVIMVMFCIGVVGVIIMMGIDNKATKAHYEHLASVHEARAKAKQERLDKEWKEHTERMAQYSRVI